MDNKFKIEIGIRLDEAEPTKPIIDLISLLCEIASRFGTISKKGYSAIDAVTDVLVRDHGLVVIPKKSSLQMTNAEVARQFAANAMAYARGGDMQTVLANLRMISKLLETPLVPNEDFSWGDFK